MGKLNHAQLYYQFHAVLNALADNDVAAYLDAIKAFNAFFNNLDDQAKQDFQALLTQNSNPGLLAEQLNQQWQLAHHYIPSIDKQMQTQGKLINAPGMHPQLVILLQEQNRNNFANNLQAAIEAQPSVALTDSQGLDTSSDAVQRIHQVVIYNIPKMTPEMAAMVQFEINQKHNAGTDVVGSKEPTYDLESETAQHHAALVEIAQNIQTAMRAGNLNAYAEGLQAFSDYLWQHRDAKLPQSLDGINFSADEQAFWYAFDDAAYQVRAYAEQHPQDILANAAGQYTTQLMNASGYFAQLTQIKPPTETTDNPHAKTVAKFFKHYRTELDDAARKLPEETLSTLGPVLNISVQATIDPLRVIETAAKEPDGDLVKAAELYRKLLKAKKALDGGLRIKLRNLPEEQRTASLQRNLEQLDRANADYNDVAQKLLLAIMSNDPSQLRAMLDDQALQSIINRVISTSCSAHVYDQAVREQQRAESELKKSNNLSEVEIASLESDRQTAIHLQTKVSEAMRSQLISDTPIIEHEAAFNLYATAEKMIGRLQHEKDRLDDKSERNYRQAQRDMLDSGIEFARGAQSTVLQTKVLEGDGSLDRKVDHCQQALALKTLAMRKQAERQQHPSRVKRTLDKIRNSLINLKKKPRKKFAATTDTVVEDLQDMNPIGEELTDMLERERISIQQQLQILSQDIETLKASITTMRGKVPARQIKNIVDNDLNPLKSAHSQLLQREKNLEHHVSQLMLDHPDKSFEEIAVMHADEVRSDLMLTLQGIQNQERFDSCQLMHQASPSPPQLVH